MVGSELRSPNKVPLIFGNSHAPAQEVERVSMPPRPLAPESIELKSCKFRILEPTHLDYFFLRVVVVVVVGSE